MRSSLGERRLQHPVEDVTLALPSEHLSGCPYDHPKSVPPGVAD
jgi:hypothetical protein